MKGPTDSSYVQSWDLANKVAITRLETAIIEAKPDRKLSLSELSAIGGISSLGAAFTMIVPTIPKSS